MYSNPTVNLNGMWRAPTICHGWVEGVERRNFNENINLTVATGVRARSNATQVIFLAVFLKEYHQSYVDLDEISLVAQKGDF